MPLAVPSIPRDVESRIVDMITKMSIHEKVALCAGAGGWAMGECPRLGIKPLRVMDGPHGVRTIKATAFPSGISMAATWDAGLVHRVGAALAEETRAAGYDVLLGPCVNIVRVPLAGRNFETYAEDPWLAGRIGVSYVKGVQGRGVGTSLKHFACNNQEIERGRGSSVVDERTLREIYLAQFEQIVKEADPWTVMCSYNRINGEHASQNRRLLNDILRDEWGYAGVVISDWGAVHNVRESMAAGLDVEMPGKPKFRTGLLVETVDTWQLDAGVIDDAVRRVLRLYYRAGLFDRGYRPPRGAINTRPHQELARNVAEEAIVLLKNDAGTLPIDLRAIRSLAVIGPNADRAIAGGGSSWVDAPYAVTPLQALRARCGRRVRVEHEMGCENIAELHTPAKELLVPANGKGHGLSAEYFNNSDLSGAPVAARIEDSIHLWCWNNAPMEPVQKERWSGRWRGWYIAQETGLTTLSLTGQGQLRLYVNGKKLGETTMPDRFREGTTHREISADVEMTKGKRYALRAEYVKCPNEISAFFRLGIGRSQKIGYGAEIKRAAQVAARCDAAIVCIGLPDRFESEGRDRPHMELTGEQDRLVRAVVRANPRTIVVVNAGAPVTMPWADEAPAVLMAWYPGMEGGNAIAGILFGSVNPSGKLPITLPLRHEDTPGYLAYPGTREAFYGEGLFVGYRWYDKRDMRVLFPFGHGLSYTKFNYSGLSLPSRVAISDDMRVDVRVTIENAGDRPGAEVVQLYVGDAKCTLPRPVRELKAFARVFLKPGQKKRIRLSLDKRSFALYEPYRGEWVVEPGEFEIGVGSSSRDLRVRKSIAAK